ncbi:MAG: peptidase, partial [Bdellovibrionales bacterium]
MNQGYFRAPTVHGDRVVFVSEDDLWLVNTQGGPARRLTSGVGAATQPVFSNDGKWLAFSSEEEGHREVYVCDSDGGEVRRVTYLGSISIPVTWTADGKIVFRTRAKHPHGVDELFQVSAQGGVPEALRLGPAVWLAFSSQGEVALERNSNRPDPAHWKRYRGGTAGVIWVSDGLDKPFSKPLSLKSNMARPMWIQDRLYFLSDHEGVANIYSVRKDGGDIKRHTKLKEYYCRNPQTDGRTIVFHAGGDLYTLDVARNKVSRLDVDYRSQRTQRQRKFVSAARHLESYSLSPKADQVQVTTRGQVFAFRNWDGPVFRYGQASAVRYRLSDWLGDGQKLVVVSDEGGAEQLEVYTVGDPASRQIVDGLDIGRVTALKANPKNMSVVLTNHRNELILVNLETKSAQVLARCEHAHLEHCEWSPDGRMIAFRQTQNPQTSFIAVHVVSENKTYAVTKPLLHDQAPSWDPEGRYLYFLSTRILDPVYDNAQFELSFPRAVIPCLITLRRDLPSPFVVPVNSGEKEEDKK